MLPLHGVVFSVHPQDRLKRQALLFDKFRVIDMRGKAHPNPAAPSSAEWDFLEDRGLVQMAPEHLSEEPLSKIGIGPSASRAEIWDAFNRAVAAYLSDSETDVVPICRDHIPARFRSPLADDSGQKTTAMSVLNIAFEALPAPSDQTPWMEILEFKDQTYNKQWGFRRFLQKLTSTKQTEREIRDEFEWLLHEYEEAMKIHKMKSALTFVDVFVITPLEIIENLAKFNLSKLAKGVFSARKRRVELMEAESKAPGRECAYVFDARERFKR